MDSLKLLPNEQGVLWLAVSEELKRQRHYASVLDDEYAKSIALQNIKTLEALEYKLDVRRELQKLEQPGRVGR